MSFAASKITDRTKYLLSDLGFTGWTTSELHQWITDALRDIAGVKPDAFSATVTHALVAGTRQTLPSGAFILLDVIRNMGEDTATPGRVPRIIARDKFDTQNPSWHTATASSTVRFVMFDMVDQKTFYVSPPQPATPGSLDIVAAFQPTAITAGTDQITLDETWIPAIVNYVMFRALSKDSTKGEPQIAMAYFGAFNAQLAGRGAAEVAHDINNREESRPNTPV